MIIENEESVTEAVLDAYSRTADPRCAKSCWRWCGICMALCGRCG